MRTLLQVDFKYNGPFGKELAAAVKDIANSINSEPGIVWKIWTENEARHEAGGVYLFENKITAEAYLKMHTYRLKNMGISEVRSRIFDVNKPLSEINEGPIA